MQTRTAPDFASVFTVLSRLVEAGFVILSPTGEIEFASDRARELLGCGDRLDLHACHPESATAIRDLVQSIKSDAARSVHKEIRIEVDEDIRHVSLGIHGLDEESCTGFLLSVKDAENVRRMATDLRLAAQFRNTRRLCQAMVRDLKQPLSAVMVHADLLRDMLAPENGEDEVAQEIRSLEVIRKHIGELNRALTLLLEEINPADTEERAFSLRDVVEDVVRLIKPQASAQDVRLECACSDHMARLNGSRQRVKQAVLNLAVNALDAMPDGGTLTIELDVVDGQADLRIRDTGVGIDEAVLPHVFEMHFTTKQTGTGVGLYVAREVIKRHDGSIEILASEAGAGTTFRVRLPVSESAS